MEKKRIQIFLFAGMGVVLAAVLGYILLAGNALREQPGNGPAETSGTVTLPSSGTQTRIDLSPSGGTVTGPGAEISGSRVTIRQGGEYQIAGSLQGQIYVEAGSSDTVVLRLAGAEITNDAEAALHVENAGTTLLWLDEGTENLIQSGTAPAEGVLGTVPDDSASGGAVYARDDLTLAGEGSLRVLGYLNNGIQTSNHLVVSGGSISVEARNNGLKGKDSVTVTGGSLDILAGGDGVKSDDTTGEGYGTVAVSGGSLSVRAQGDGIQAETALEVTGGSLDLVTGGGSEKAVFPSAAGRGGSDSDWDREEEGQTSSKGLKGGTAVTVSGGVVAADCLDDAIHSNGEVTLTGGEIALASGDDGVHADGSLVIQEGKVTVTCSYEGLEGNLVTIAGGVIEVTAADDGINACGGQRRMGGPGQNQGGKSTDTMPELTITGGTVTVNADGDGLDSNGNLTLQGGTVIINGPSGSGNGALDYGSENGGSCTVSGGVVLALGSGAMAETFGEGSTQYSFRYGFEKAFAAGDEIVVLGAGGSELFRHQAVKSGSSVVFSAPGLVQGGVYTLRAGDQTAEITLDSISTNAGAGGGFGGGFGGGPGGRGGEHGGFMAQPPEGMPERRPGRRPGMDEAQDRPAAGL